MLASGFGGTAAARAADYVPGEIVVQYAPWAPTTSSLHVQRMMGVRAAAAGPSAGAQILRLPRGVSIQRAISRLRAQPGVVYAVPNYIAHVAGSWIPNDPGTSHEPHGWEAMQWNFLPATGVDAPGAWANLRADHRPGGRGVVVAILDTGVAYRNWHRFRKSPDFQGTRFVHPYDFIAHNRDPLDREGHGTFVAGTVAEATNNGLGLTGLAYGASIMPVRVLNGDGEGDASTIARGIRYAATHGARVINLSLEFDLTVRAAAIPEIISAIGFANRHGAVAVAAAGNDYSQQLAYPAADRSAISVGATTRDLCLAEYSNVSPDLDLVAPGGGMDTSTLSDPNCDPGRPLPDIYQMTFSNPSHPNHFGFPNGWYGTSMAAPHVAAIAALVIASDVVGRRPSPGHILRRLEQTARPLGGPTPNPDYGYGLVDAATATARTKLA
jgi:serine protease